ncbi:hypothetical protein VTI74DRAFT_3978 [Chaetomium olivicolor]
MTLPKPKVALNNACSVIFNNTLYTYSADAFQSLRLEPGAKWEELNQGEKVTGGVCVGSTTGTPSTSAFFVVGGTGGSDGYRGLQKYTYATGQWENIQLASKVPHQRVGHSAVYLNSTDSILIYGGSQDGSNDPSSQTFTIGASAPYIVDSYDPYAPLSFKPILLPWSAGEAVLIGGSTSNKKVMLFNSAERKWVDSGATLADGLPKDTSAIQAVLLTGDDGSKHFITFDMTVSPNAVKRTVLYSGPGVPVTNAAPVRKRTSRRSSGDPVSNTKREVLTVNNWPAYNSTGAPKTTRSSFALAQGPDGMVVIAGGNDDDVLCMFDARQNSWEDANSRLGQIKLLSVESSTASASSTATRTETTTATSLASTSNSVPATITTSAAATETPTGSPAAAAAESSGPQLNTILGAVLGGFFGLAFFLILAYLCIKRRKRRQAHMEAGHSRRASGPSSSEKNGMGFAKETFALEQTPPRGFRGHQPQGSQSSFSSLAIFLGRAGEHKSMPSVLSRKMSNESSRDSSDNTFRAFKSTISKPIPQVTSTPAASRSPPPQQQQQTRDEKGVASAASTAEPRPRNLTTAANNGQEGTRRSSGWNRYWSGGSALNLLGFGSGNRTSNGASTGNGNGNVTSQRATMVSERSSNYSDPHRMTQDSATVPPLFPRTAEPRLSFSRVTAHSPTIAVYNDRFNEGLSGHIETGRPVSAVSDMSASAYSSGIPESVQEAWDPTAANKLWGADRFVNNSATGIYSTPLTPPAAQAPKPTPPPRQVQAPVRDDMSWLNLGGS